MLLVRGRNQQPHRPAESTVWTSQLFNRDPAHLYRQKLGIDFRKDGITMRASFRLKSAL
jgi:hypothetical protein